MDPSRLAWLRSTAGLRDVFWIPTEPLLRTPDDARRYQVVREVLDALATAQRRVDLLETLLREMRSILDAMEDDIGAQVHNALARITEALPAEPDPILQHLRRTP
jgi:hypothetical protein